jgi:hypothetical protein
MRWRRRIRIDRDGLSVAADVNAAISVNRGRAGETNVVRSVSHARVVQDSRGGVQEPGGAANPEDERKEHE